jgi:hypothetical protein
MGGSKYFYDLFRPQFSQHVVQVQLSGAPSGKVGPPFKLTFFTEMSCLYGSRAGQLSETAR